MSTELNNRQQLRQLRADIEAALATVATKHGITIEFGRGTYEPNGSEFRGKITCRSKTPVKSPVIESWRPDAESLASIQEMTDRFMSNREPTTSQLNPTLEAAMKRFGITGTRNAKGDRLVNYNPRAPKFCFEYRSARGTDWKITPEQAKKRFG